MELACELSPVVFSELYRLLAAETRWADRLDDRLANVGLGHAWLAEAADRYDARWRAEVERGQVLNDVYSLRDLHAVLASWVLAGLRGMPSSANDLSDLTTDLSGRVLGRVIDDIPGASTSLLPPSLRPNVCAWVLCAVHGNVDAELPLALPMSIPDADHVRLGYEGLLEHCAALDHRLQPWPEMVSTSTVWRSFGLAESMRPDQDSQQKSVYALLAEVRNFVTTPVYSRLSTHWAGDEKLRITRNVLTHVLRTNKDENGNRDKIEVRFSEAVQSAREWTEIRPTIHGVTVFLCNQLSAVLDAMSPGADGCPVNDSTWDEISEWDLWVG